MASVQQLEKLYQIQRLFNNDSSLESVVANERIQLLIDRTEQLIQQKAFLRDERRKARASGDFLIQRKEALVKMQRDDWMTLQPLDFNTIQINVGGLMFETPSSVLGRDPSSALAKLSRPREEGDGDYHTFDRDWWLFRYILRFLRDGSLPDDRNLLAQLYKECSFWQLGEMQRAIEEEKLHLRPPNKDKPNPWWRKLPSWWQAIDEEKKKVAAAAAQSTNKKTDWWKDTSYGGKVYLPLSTDPLKVVAKAGEKDEKRCPILTWEAAT
mmetsp:Transcript_28981/g.39807  ORF Transcript_28981/g.39807 Transcript_28981/m.39807 type:complete len:268 (-) Transcript_28981:15-818(-)|eukprot:CAMPEP_0170076974 /NCGR_PEP_ID=MMETSP0019_2-20121128/13877_1 /TAXON_ID=98059 /ORGANISM="Dinobryon sp., Strain UTEXLB2267" /LENGTH=267 /DNA_ID=CAMNT_0010289011 /DNA_START=10 /DNA_END=813 /DNA_ORIENTATION=+